MTIQIRPIHETEVDAAKEVILTVAHQLFAPDTTWESFREYFLQVENLSDMDRVDDLYVPPAGLFLVALDNDRLVGTGAIRRLDEQTAEIKRMWLLDAYQGQGIGFRVIDELLHFARQQQYRSVYLTTSWAQQRAIQFYQQIGFQQVPARSPDVEEYGLALELVL